MPDIRSKDKEVRMKEYSKEPRFDVHWPLSLGHRTAGNIYGQTQTVSVSGCHCLVHEPYNVGDFAEIELTPDASTSIRCLVRIVHSAALLTKEFGVEVEFVQFKGDGHELLNELLLEIKQNRWK